MDISITDADIERSRSDQRFKQLLLAKSLEQLLDMLYRLQHSASTMEGAEAESLREGATMAVQIADKIRTIDDRLSAKASAR